MYAKLDLEKKSLKCGSAFYKRTDDLLIIPRLENLGSIQAEHTVTKAVQWREVNK